VKNPVNNPHPAAPSGPPPVGRVVATELKPSTPHQFFFWTARESPVGIGAIVRVDADARTVFGVVTDGFAYSDLQTPMHAVIGADGDPAGTEEPTRRAEIRLFAAAVLRHLPEEPVQPVPLGLVHLASDAARHGRQHIDRAVADLLDGDRATQRRVVLVPPQYVTEVADA